MTEYEQIEEAKRWAAFLGIPNKWYVLKGMLDEVREREQANRRVLPQAKRAPSADDLSARKTRPGVGSA